MVWWWKRKSAAPGLQQEPLRRPGGLGPEPARYWRPTRRRMWREARVALWMGVLAAIACVTLAGGPAFADPGHAEPVGHEEGAQPQTAAMEMQTAAHGEEAVVAVTGGPQGEAVVHGHDEAEGPAGGAPHDEGSDPAWVTNRLLVVGGEAFVESLLTYVLTVLWLLVIALHLARPYMLNFIGNFTLRLGADLWWLAYILLRDLLIVATFVLSLFYYYPMLVDERPFPMTAPAAATLLLAVLLIKLAGDPDENPLHFRWVSNLLGLGSALYLVPVFLGVWGGSVPALRPLGRWLVTNQNPSLGYAIVWVSLAATGILGAIAVAYVLRSARPEAAGRQSA